MNKQTSQISGIESSKTSNTIGLLAKLDQYEEALQCIDSMDFNAFELCDILGRESFFTIVIFKLMNAIPNNNAPVIINNEKLICFLRSIYTGYRRNVAYHNDLHGADVAQMMHLFIT